jgi:Protein of unknown function (DUF1573)
MHKVQTCNMKVIIKYFVYAFALLVMAACGTDNRQVTADLLNFPPVEGSETTENVPVISFDSAICHFGIIAIGERYTHTFRFKNTGSEPLIISQVTPNCGCTTPKDWPHEPILPGESGQITVEFNSKGFPGKIEKSISVLTNCIPKEWNLKLVGDVVGLEAVPKEKPKGIEMERTR